MKPSEVRADDRVRKFRLDRMLRIYDLEKQFRRPLTLAELIEDVIGPDISPSTAAIFVETWLRTEHIRQVGDHYSLDIRGQNCVSDHLNSRRKQR